jgi:general stress protein 26
LTNQEEQLKDILDSFSNAMLITGLDDDEPNGRPMWIASHDGGEMWFITKRNTPKVEEILSDSAAMVTLQSSRAFALVHGFAAVVDDEAKLDALWNPTADLHFRRGSDSGSAVLIRFTPTRGQFWDLRGEQGLHYLAKAAEAWFKNEPLPVTAENYGAVSL